jgi:predicted nucleotidyltransferase
VGREKVAREYLENEIRYDAEQRDHFHYLRTVALPILEALQSLEPLLHGSIARGDTSKNSDIDVIIPYQITEFQIVVPLSTLRYEPMERWIIQATPLAAVKGILIFSATPPFSVTFPLIPFYPREHEFYYFGGAVGFSDLKRDLLIRVPGVNKKLLFIEPTETGHNEYRITPENAMLIAKQLNIGVDTILERIRVLERRDKVGRTGIFKKRLLTPDESFGGVLKEISETNPASRRRITRKKVS